MYRHGLNSLIAIIAFATLPETAFALDAAGVLRLADRAMGGDHLNTIRYTHTGSEFVMGQSFRPGESWPKTKGRGEAEK